MKISELIEAKFSNESFEATIEGKKYKVEVDNAGDSDINKRWIEVTLPDNKKVHVDWTPYAKFTKQDLELWIAAGMPDRKSIKSIGPLSRKDLK